MKWPAHLQLVGGGGVSYLPLYRKFPTELSLSVSMSFALISVNFIHVGDCWKNGFEHNKLVIFELKLQ